MSTSQKNPTMVSSYNEGVKLAGEFFAEMSDKRPLTVRHIGGNSYEAYTDSGSDDYFYFAVKS